MTCNCENNLRLLRVLVATLSRPYHCPACDKCVYAKTPFSEPLIVISGIVLVFVSLFFVIKGEWLDLLFSWVAVSLMMLAVRIAEVKFVGVQSENDVEYKKSKRLDFSARLVWGLVFVILMVVAYLFF